MGYCTSTRAKAAYKDFALAYRECLCGERVDRAEWLDDLRAAAIYRKSALEWYQRYRRALEKEVSR